MSGQMQTLLNLAEKNLEEWILLGIKMGHTIPVIDGIDLNVKEVV